jgi:hypothetical protein
MARTITGFIVHRSICLGPIYGDGRGEHNSTGIKEQSLEPVIMFVSRRHACQRCSQSFVRRRLNPVTEMLRFKQEVYQEHYSFGSATPSCSRSPY